MTVMPSRRPDLIVPIRDRRQHKRYLTVRNFGFALIALALIFAVITIRSEMRGLKPGEFGRLFSSGIPEPVETRPVEVVQEATPAAAPPVVAIATEPPSSTSFVIEDVGGPLPPTAAPEPIRSSASEVSVVGGPDGVSVVRKEPRPRPVLAGGFGRGQ
jgi:hypothetical protein